MSRSIRRAMIDRDHQQLSLVRQCILLDVSRASVYYRSVPTRAEDLELMALMDRQYLKTPFYGSRKMKAWLLQQGYLVSRKRVRRLMRLIGSGSDLRQKPHLSDGEVAGCLREKLSNTMDTSFCVAALEEALGKGRPEIFNTDQGSQFTSEAFTQTLQEQRVQVSMDGKGRYLDNIFVERLWRSIKYEEVYLKAYQTVAEARTGINAYLEFYNRQRNGDIPWITSADIIDIKTAKPRRFITREAIRESATNLIPKGNVIVVTRVGLGKLFTNYFDLCVSQDSQGLILKDCIDAVYLAHVLKPRVEEFKNFSQGSTIQGVTKKQLAEIRIPLPSLEVQQEIVAEIEGYQEEITSHHKQVRDLEGKIRSNIERVWGEVPTEDSNDVES